MARQIWRFVKYFSLMILVVGISILAGFLIRRIYDRRNQIKAMEDFEQRMAAYEEIYQIDHHYSGETAAQKYPELKYITGETIAILSLDRLGIKVAITEGTDKEALHMSAGHFEQSALPGEGNFCIAGHSSFIYTCLFNDLHEAKVGDEINVFSETGKHTYVVSEIMSVEPTAVELLEPENESIITIVTCNNYGEERLIIRGLETDGQL